MNDRTTPQKLNDEQITMAQLLTLKAAMQLDHDYPKVAIFRTLDNLYNLLKTGEFCEDENEP